MSGAYQEPSSIMLKPFMDKAGLIYTPDGVVGEILASQDGEYRRTDISYTVPFSCKIDKVKVILKGHLWGDHAHVEIFDPSGVHLLSKFGEKFFFDDSTQDQGWVGPDYDADLIQGLIIKLCYYTKKTSSPIDVIFNLKMHKKV